MPTYRCLYVVILPHADVGCATVRGKIDLGDACGLEPRAFPDACPVTSVHQDVLVRQLGIIKTERSSGGEPMFNRSE
jgi:hypothetical protein